MVNEKVSSNSLKIGSLEDMSFSESRENVDGSDSSLS